MSIGKVLHPSHKEKKILKSSNPRYSVFEESSPIPAGVFFGPVQKKSSILKSATQKLKTEILDPDFTVWGFPEDLRGFFLYVWGVTSPRIVGAFHMYKKKWIKVKERECAEIFTFFLHPKNVRKVLKNYFDRGFRGFLSLKKMSDSFYWREFLGLFWLHFYCFFIINK